MGSGQLGYKELMDLVTVKMLLSLAPENVVKGTLNGFSPCALSPMITNYTTDDRVSPVVIERGVEIMCDSENRSNRHIYSELREILEEAATGARLCNLVGFSALFDKLLSPQLFGTR